MIKIRLFKHVLATAALAAGVVFLAACATTTRSADDIVAERAQARWDALLAGDFETAYGYLSPGYRSGKTAGDYEFDFRTRKVRYRSAEYQDHSCEKQTCTVRMKIGFKVAKPVPGLDVWESSSVISERWIKSNNEWWFLPQK